MIKARAVWVTAAWIITALVFNAGIFVIQGHQKALEFLTGYVIELSLSIDNLFIFFLVFAHFKVDPVQQNRILFWGVLGAQLMRAIFILAGVALLKNLSWMVYALGILLVFSGLKLFLKGEQKTDLSQNVLLSLFKKFVPDKFSLFLTVLIVVEAADLIFAVDSIPAVLAVTKDPFIVYSSNIFAILGLRAMYFILSPVMVKFGYLHYALGAILALTGTKMLTDPFWHMPTGYALGFIALVLMIFSLITLKNSSKKGIV